MKKLRVQWLKASDRNSSFFFKAINGKCNRSKIHSTTGDDSSLIKGDILVKNADIRHFQTIFGCSMPARHGIGSTLSNIIDMVISNDRADFIGRDITNDKIREVFFSLHPNKATGPDGFNSYFFKITWDIVGEDAISVVQEFFRSGVLLMELNATILVLVPKSPYTLWKNQDVRGDMYGDIPKSPMKLPYTLEKNNKTKATLEATCTSGLACRLTHCGKNSSLRPLVRRHVQVALHVT
ncbi:hypothetical protein Dsin_018757 [Dipteronia sinensis]|uniref:RNA-directed DNA polymerase, eukaryota, reverse transcriptase zinc-binding domain protein n=1 Tax=Dipteronia sinensis TaxID=43782 RepID=A0AAE0A628_9ROSI|nr:hypothetical protein Dsin_018757 [Dipteronia sinensis]